MSQRIEHTSNLFDISQTVIEDARIMESTKEARQMATLVKDNAAREAEDAASHGYHGRDGRGAQLLKRCAAAVRGAAWAIERRFNVPAISADERAEYASDLVARILGDHGGRIPAADEIKNSYLTKRAEGMILNDRSRRYGCEYNEFHEHPGPQIGEGEAGRDDRLSGPLLLTDDVERLAAELELSETGKRALAACMIPATRQEWADLFGYGSGKAFHVICHRGRRELVACGEQAIRDALAKIEQERGED